MRLVKFKVKGAGSYKASANGDPTCLDLFHLPQMHAFNGMLTAIVQAGEKTVYLNLKLPPKDSRQENTNFNQIKSTNTPNHRQDTV